MCLIWIHPQKNGSTFDKLSKYESIAINFEKTKIHFLAKFSLQRSLRGKVQLLQENTSSENKNNN